MTTRLLGLFLMTCLMAQAQVSFTGAPYTQNFDSMGSGTAAPAGWSFFGALGGGNSTWTAATGIPASAIGGGTANAALIANTAFASTSNTAGFNFALSTSTTNRALGTSPTSGQGVVLQLALTNDSGAAITSVRLGFDIRRFTAPATANELPGYWLFYSTDNGVTWTNAPALNSTASNVPNTTGVTTVPLTSVLLASPWAAGGQLRLRWVDDNATQTSPDQIVGIDNLTLAPPIGQAPTVALTSPTTGASFTQGASVDLAATANDADGNITKVEFFQGSTKLGEDLTDPFAYTWTNAPAGSFALTAIATDNDGNATTSSPASISVSATGSGTLTRGPYLQQAGANRMTIRWRSSNAIVGRVRFGTTPGALNTIVDETAATTEHVVTLTGLAASTTYYYSVGSALDTLIGDATTTFITSPVTGSSSPTRIWVLGDAGTGTASQMAVRDAFYNWTGTNDPQFVLQLGDNAYESGTDAEYQSKMFDVYSSVMRRSTFWSCLGNHDTGSSTAFVDTYPYFGQHTFPTAGECGGVASGTEHYFSFDYGNIHVISLDSMTASRSPTGAMAQWLANDLASTTATWIICIFHHPPYTKGSHDSDTETPLVEMRTNILPILEQGGVDLVLCGHSHSYERSKLLDGHYGLSTTLTAAMVLNGGDGRIAGNGSYVKPLSGVRAHNGAVYAVPGSAGKISGGTLNHPAHFISLNQLGSMVLDINGDRLDATFLRETGAVADTFTIEKRDPPVFTSNPISAAAATEDAAYSASIAGSAADANVSDTLTYSLVSAPTWLSIASNGAISGTPTQVHVGANSFTVRVTDSTGLFAEAALQITVTNVNDAPTITGPVTGSVNAGSAFSQQLSGADEDFGDTLTFTGIGAPTWLNISASGLMSGTPTDESVGTSNFTVRVTDTTGAFDETSASVTVLPVNQAPVWSANPIPLNATEDSSYDSSIASLATDADVGDTLTFSGTGLPTWLTLSSNGTLTGTPTNENDGTASFTARVTDSVGAFADTTVQITVANVNDAPAWSSSNFTKPDATLGLPYTGQTLAGLANDVDLGDMLSYSLVTTGTWLSVASNGALSGTPSGDTGAQVFTVRVTDSAAVSVDATLTINVVGLPAPWANVKLGDGLVGSASFSGSIFTLSGSGVIGGTADREQFVYQTLSGDGSIIARITAPATVTSNSARIGIQIRDSLATNSPALTLSVNSSSAFKWMRRTTAGGNTASSNSNSGTAPNIWVRLVRAGNVITASKSTNGTTWTTIGSVTVTLATNCYVGLTTSSGSNTTLNSSNFDNVTVVP